MSEAKLLKFLNSTQSLDANAVSSARQGVEVCNNFNVEFSI